MWAVYGWPQALGDVRREMAAMSNAAGPRNVPFFSSGLAQADPEIAHAVADELKRQQEKIELIASENIVSKAVLEAQGSVLTNKYAEGYPGRRYYGGCEYVDVAEELAIDRAKRLFDCSFRQCSAPFGRAGESGGVLRAHAAGRRLHGPQPRRRWPSDARLSGQPVRASGSSRSRTACAARTIASTWTRSSRWRSPTSRS